MTGEGDTKRTDAECSSVSSVVVLGYFVQFLTQIAHQGPQGQVPAAGRGVLAVTRVITSLYRQTDLAKNVTT